MLSTLENQKGKFLTITFYYIHGVWQLVDEEKIHNQCLSDDPKERIDALNKLRSFFSVIPDKQQAWNELHRLTNDKDTDVRSKAVSLLGSVFYQMPDKQQAWNDLVRLTNRASWHTSWSERSNAANVLSYVFSQVPDKQQAWNDLHRLTNDEDSHVRKSASKALGSVISQVPDKQQAWNDLHRLTNDEDSSVRYKAVPALGFAFSQAPDKQQAWNDLHRLTNDEDSNVRKSAVSVLGSAFSQLPDKQQAWNDLHRLTNDEDSDVRYRAVPALGSVFFQVPDKQQAWNDLHRLINEENSSVRESAISVLGSVFSQVPDKQQAWNDLHRLINEESHEMRSAISFLSDERSSAISVLGFVFSQVPDKQQAWNDLHRLINDKDYWVRRSAVKALGSAFSQLPDKQQAWNDLLSLTNDYDSWVRTSSNHSLGRASIFMASQAETYEDYKKELEKAIEFFRIAAKENRYDNPAQFCLPFYRSFHTIIFKKQEAREEVNKYLEKAKSAIKGSESKKQLFEVVQNLAEALKEVQNMGNLDLSGMKDELNFYRKYWDHAAELIRCTDEKTPFAAGVLRKGLPILDRNLRELLKEIQEKATTSCQASKGTTTEEIACAVRQEVQGWVISNQKEMSWQVENLIFILESSVPKILENQAIFDKIEQIRQEKDLARQYELIGTIFSKIPYLIIKQEISGLAKEVHQIKKTVDILTINFNLGSAIKQEIEISSGIEILGTGATLITTIPLQEISYAELKEDLQRLKGEHINKLSELPKRLANKIKGYLLLKDREDIVEKLT